MKKTTLSIFALACMVFTGQLSAQAVDAAMDVNPNPIIGHDEIAVTGTYQVMGASGVIYSNGPYFDTAGGGFSGADLSTLENTSLGEAILGFGMNTGAAGRLADDVEIFETVEITSIDFYGYQTGSPTTSSFNFMSLRVWDGIPGDANSNVVYGDISTNMLTSTTWSGAYRATEAAPMGATRPIMINRVNTPGLILPAGTYWLDWNAGGTINSGPWAPPLTLLGSSATGNAVQYTASTNAWTPVLDFSSDNSTGTSTPQGFPFEVNGMVLSIAENIIEGFSYYPNPVKDVLFIQSQSAIEAIVIYNMLGQKMLVQTPATMNSNIDLSGLSSGMYVMKATVNGMTASFPLIRK